MLRSGNVSGENVITMDVQLAHITCPITNEIFLDPAMLVPCGHVFESAAIKKWISSHATCPCCRQNIEKLMDAPPLLHEMLDNTLAKYPDLQRQRYYSLDILHKVVMMEDSSKLDKIIVFLLLSEDLINVINEKGDSVIWWLTRNPFGLAALARHDKLRAKINADSLNHTSNRIHYQGNTALAWLLCHEIGVEILEKDANFRAKITPYGLNNIITGSYDRGTSALYWLLTKKSGVQMLCWDKELRAKVTEEGLNSIQLGKRHDLDKNVGLSALYYLVIHEEGLQILHEDNILREKITAKGLNAICQGEQLLGRSPLYVLVQTQRGRDLLNMDDRLRKLVTMKTLYAKDQATGKTVADCLQQTIDGVDLLRKLDPYWKEKIPVKNSHAMRVHGVFREQQNNSHAVPTQKRYKKSHCNII